MEAKQAENNIFTPLLHRLVEQITVIAYVCQMLIRCTTLFYVLYSF